MTDTFQPKKSLGQNFLTDPYYLQRIVDAAEIREGDQVVEIGAGMGQLTRLLADRAKRLLAIEIDNRLYELLLKEFSGNPRVQIVHADALEFPFERLTGLWKLVANLPYYISTPIIQRLIRLHSMFVRMTLMLQKEVAERIVSCPGGKEYGYLSLLVQVYTEPRIEFIVPPAAFSPRPDVDSAVVTFDVRKTPLVEPRSEGHLFKVIKACFSQRRKTLRNALRSMGISGDKMSEVELRSGIDLGRRAETLGIEEFKRLSEAIISIDESTMNRFYKGE